MIKYFRSKDLSIFTKGFDSDWIDDPKLITGESDEITEEEFYREKENELFKVRDNLECGLYEIQHFQKVQLFDDGDVEQLEAFYIIVRFVKNL